MPDPRYSELPLSAQTAYAELDNALAGLSDSFHTLTRKTTTTGISRIAKPASSVRA